MKIKTGDNVIITTGKDKGHTGKVIKVLKHDNKVVIDGLNMRKKTIKASQAGQGSGIIEVPAAMDASNVMIVDPKTKKPSRIGKKKVGDKFVRIATKSGQEI